MNAWVAPIIPDRLPGWEHAYARELQRQADTEFSWGDADCITRVADLCAAMTGVNPFPPKMRRHTTAIGAQRVLTKLGFATIEDALTATFPETPKLRARRGDCGVGEVRIAGVATLAAFIVMGSSAVGSNARGPVVVSTLALKKTFRIG